MTDDEAVIAKLEADDQEVARDAEAALEWLTAGGGLGVITQEAVQTFLWYELPMKWLSDTGHRRRVADALARAFDLLALPRYTALCRSDTTASVLDAYERGDAKGKKAFDKANIASGIRPPDTAELQWNSVMDREERRAWSATAEFLERAVVGGELVPGARGWKARQAELVRAYLTTPQTELGGRTFLDAVRAERMQAWLRGWQRPTRRRLLDPIAEHVTSPTELPPGTDDPVPPLRWLLEQLVDGQELTQHAYLNRAFVQDAATRFGWWDVEAHGLPRSEADLFCLSETRALAYRTGLIRRLGTKLLLSRKGRALLDDPVGLWRVAAHELLPTHRFDCANGETALVILLGSDSVTYEQLSAMVAKVIIEDGWRERYSGNPVDKPSIQTSMHETLNLCRTLNLLSTSGHWGDRLYVLSEVGRATALEALHHSAIGPRSNLWG
jgi:hypothetical protein